MVLRSEDNKQYFFHGHKELRSDGFTEIGIRDSTTLFVKIYEGENEKGNLIGEGTLSTKLSDFVKQLRTITVTNTESSIERMKWKFAFGKFFASSLWHTYSSLSSGSLLDSNAPPREKRELKLDGVVPEIYKVVTEDKVSRFYDFPLCMLKTRPSEQALFGKHLKFCLSVWPSHKQVLDTYCGKDKIF